VTGSVSAAEFHGAGPLEPSGYQGFTAFGRAEKNLGPGARILSTPRLCSDTMAAFATKRAQLNNMENPPVSEDLFQRWSEVAAELKNQVTVDTWQRWFKDVVALSVDDEKLTLEVPNKIHQFWIESNYLSLLEAITGLTFGGRRAIHFVVAEQIDPEPREVLSSRIPAAAIERAMPSPVVVERVDDEGPSGTAGLNSKNTFASFVVGANNQFAHAACKAVSDSPAKTYNPLFIYGGVGLGKTHLMHAIGHQIRNRKKGAKVLYITSELFTNEFIDAIQTGGLVKFRRRYRQADALLIDDIQFFSGKERSQEEFFHTYNALFDGHKQIVLSSDCPPSEIQSLEARLVSRFEWGLTAELLPPDTETRVAILRKKAEAMDIKLESHVLQFMAERIRSNVRRLEGALMRAASFTSLNDGQNPTIDRLEILLKDLLQEEARNVITIDQIQKRVAEHFDVRLADMTSKRRPANIAFPRQIAMYFAREYTKASLCEIGEAFGGRDHGTVIHAHRKVKERVKSDEKIRQVVGYLGGQLQR
jgi:chromosomal replication initiator protein